MNIQAMMKQAQKMQKDMLAAKEEIDSKVFTASSSFVTVKVKGNKEIQEVKIDTDHLDKDDLEILEDMIMVALNNAFKKVDELREKKMSKYTNMMPGLF